MNINIKATAFELSPAIRDYVQKRFDAAGRFLESDPSTKIDVEVGRTTSHHKNGDVFRAEIHIVGAHRNVYAEAEEADLYAAIDAVRDEILRRLSSDKGRKLSRMRRGGAAVKSMIKGFWKAKGTDGEVNSAE